MRLVLASMCFLAAARVGLLASTPVVAEDVHLESTTSFVIYEVSSPGSAAFLARRRLVQAVGLDYVHPLVDVRDAERAVPTLSAHIDLRLDQEFGRTCIRGDRCIREDIIDDRSTYQPLVELTELDLPAAYLETRGLPAGLRARVGRHVVVGGLGFARVDGASASLAPVPWAEVDAYGGVLVRRTSFAGAAAFEEDGVLRLDLPREAEEFDQPFVLAPVRTWMVGGGVELGRIDWVRGRFDFREMREEHHLVARRAALTLISEPVSILHFTTVGVMDLFDGSIIEAVGATELEVTPAWVLDASVEWREPRFDPASIWGYFDLVPVLEGRLGATWLPTDRVRVGLAGNARRATFDVGPNENDFGADASVGVRIRTWGFGGYGSLWRGDLGPDASASLYLHKRFTSRIALDLRASGWQVKNPNRSFHGISTSETAGVQITLTDQTVLAGQMEHVRSRFAGNHFRGMALLTLEAWR